MKTSIKTPLTAAALIIACTFTTNAFAQDNAAKRELAVKLAKIQQKTDVPALTEQITTGVAQPVIVGWSQRLDETVPPAKQKDVRDKLDAELKKFVDTTRKTIETQANKTAEESLVPVFMEKLSEEDMKTVIAYLESPVSKKYQSLGPEATNAWAQKIFEASSKTVEDAAKKFDAAAEKIINSASNTGKKAPAKTTK